MSLHFSTLLSARLTWDSRVKVCTALHCTVLYCTRNCTSSSKVPLHYALGLELTFLNCLPWSSCRHCWTTSRRRSRTLWDTWRRTWETTSWIENSERWAHTRTPWYFHLNDYFSSAYQHGCLNVTSKRYEICVGFCMGERCAKGYAPSI